MKSILVIWDDDANQFDKQVIANRFFNIAASMWEIQQESTQAVITVVHIFLISIQYVDIKTIPQKTKKTKQNWLVHTSKVLKSMWTQHRAVARGVLGVLHPHNFLKLRYSENNLSVRKATVT